MWRLRRIPRLQVLSTSSIHQSDSELICCHCSRLSSIIKIYFHGYHLNEVKFAPKFASNLNTYSRRSSELSEILFQIKACQNCLSWSKNLYQGAIGYNSLQSVNAKYAPIQCQICNDPMPNMLHNWHCVHIWHCVACKKGIVCTIGIVCIYGIVRHAKMALSAYLALCTCTIGIVCTFGIVWKRKWHCLHNWHCVDCINGIVCIIGIVWLA